MARVLSILAIATAVLSVANAMPSFPAKIPNGANVAGIKAFGHVDGKGDLIELNKFDQGFNSASQLWPKAFCQEDSDGDGQTNGQELGDSCCEWKAGSKPKFSTGISHPGDATKKVSADVLAKNACGRTTNTTAPKSLSAVNFRTNLSPV